MNENNNYKQREFHNLNKNKSSVNINKNCLSSKFNNAQNKNFLPKVEIKNNKNKIFTDSNYIKKNYLYDINDKEEENFKEITNLMKKMINE